MLDHETILWALRILEEITRELESGREINHDDIRLLLTFFRDFADGCHHVKEEAILFPALLLADQSLQNEPLRTMNYEHERGRALTTAMADALDRNTKEDFLIYAHRYIDLVNEHIEKEQGFLFELAERILTEEEDDKIADDIESFERNIVGTQARQRLTAVVEDLGSKYLRAVAVGRRRQ